MSQTVWNEMFHTDGSSYFASDDLDSNSSFIGDGTDYKFKSSQPLDTYKEKYLEYYN